MNFFCFLDRCESVYLSTRSGAWVVPNYLFGVPTDMYACRAFFWIRWKVGSTIFENIVRMISGDPKKYGVFKVTNRFYYQIRVLYLNWFHWFENIEAFKKKN